MCGGITVMHLPAAIPAPAYPASPRKKGPGFLLFLISSVPRAFRAPAFSSFCAAGHFDPFPVDECIGNFPAGFVEIAPRGLTRDPEFFCCFFLF